MQEIKYDEHGLIIAGDRRYTNNHNLPDEVVRAILKDRYTTPGEKPSDFSASTLTAPIQQTVLIEKFPKLLKNFDVVDDYWSFMGSVAHQVLEEAWHESMGSIVEERLYMDVLGKVLSGKLDCYHEPEIRDYKTCKVYKVMKGDYSEWEKGQNIYAQLCRKMGRKVEAIKIVLMITDWKKTECYKPNYPKSPIMMIELRLWSEKEAMSYINHRAKNLLNAMAVRGTEELTIAQELAERFPCTDKEMWEDVKDWAIMKNGTDKDSRATKIFDNEEEATACLGEKGWHDSHYVLKRMSPRKRCIDWCAAKPICEQYKKYAGIEEEDDGITPLF